MRLVRFNRRHPDGIPPDQIWINPDFVISVSADDGGVTTIIVDGFDEYLCVHESVDDVVICLVSGGILEASSRKKKP